jgi:DnaA family protein
VSPQLPLALKFPPDQRFETYVGNPLARELCEAVAAGMRADWLFLGAAAGTGKSHLLMAGCHAAQAAGRKAAYLPLRTLGPDLAPALAGIERNDWIAIDDLDAVAGDRDGALALFDLHNRVRAAGGQVAYAASAMPEALGLALPDLRSRLEQCVRLPLEPLDDAGRREVLLRRARRRGLELEEAVLDYLFRRVGRDLVGLTALLDRLDRESLVAQRRITIPFLRQFLSA